MIIGDIMIDTNLWKGKILNLFSALRPEDYVIFGLILILIWSHL